MLTVECLADPLSFDALQPEWNRLLSASQSDCFFLTWEWLSTWWRHLSSGRRLVLVTARSHSELVAIAPFVATRRFRFGHPLETLEFLGSGFVGSDYLDIIVREGYGEDATGAITTYLSRQSYALRCTNVVQDARVGAVAEKLGRLHWSLRDTAVNVCPYIPLAGATWESYMATLGAEHRYNFRRKWQRLNRDFAVHWETASSEVESRAAIDRLIELHRLRWQDHGASDAFHKPELVDFHRAIAPLAFGRGWLRIYTLWLNERPAACLYGFLYGGKFYFYQSGFDPAFARNSVGLVTMGLAIRDAIAEGAHEFDLLHGDEDYKQHWSAARRCLKRYELFPAHTLGRISEKALEMIRNTRRMAPRVLNIAR